MNEKWRNFPKVAPLGKLLLARVPLCVCVLLPFLSFFVKMLISLLTNQCPPPSSLLHSQSIHVLLPMLLGLIQVQAVSQSAVHAHKYMQSHTHTHTGLICKFAWAAILTIQYFNTLLHLYIQYYTTDCSIAVKKGPCHLYLQRLHN